MDPNEALRAIREITTAWANDELFEDPIDTFDALAGTCKALDEWLSKGGFLPSAWQPGVGEIDPDYVLDRIVPLGPPNPAHAELPEHGLDMRDTGHRYEARCDCGEWQFAAHTEAQAFAMYEAHLRRSGVPDHR